MANDSPQLMLLDNRPLWMDHWKDMPEFTHEDLMPWRSCVIHFESHVDYEAFFALLDQKFTDATKSIWYPELEIRRYSDKRYSHE